MINLIDSCLYPHGVNMSSLTANQFSEFYQAIHGREPFPWQVRVAKRACEGNWPTIIALPTASGKTACIDIAVFALSIQVDQNPRQAARRIFFVVDRRVVVDQACTTAEHLADKLEQAKTGILFEVATALKKIGQTDRPLDVYTLRGGMYRENVWIRSPLQPTVICSTVDQVGSRLLFRGYGVSDSMKPIHAGLVGNDSLILLEEAHCARPFSQTTNAITRLRQWNQPLANFQLVTMSATPDEEPPPEMIERDNADDQAHPVLSKRLSAKKETKLVIAEKAKGKKYRPELVKILADNARKLMADGCHAVGVIVNRVATARELATALRTPPNSKVKVTELPEVVLLTGRMRPLDRDRQIEKLQPLLSGKSTETKPVFVVATQCLECGADLDLHGLVTEAASLDALRQRFGRLNRIAARENAQAVIVIRQDQVDDSSEDPVYGDSVANTWKWLSQNIQNNQIDFGINAMRALTTDVDLKPLNAPTVDAPILLPAHLDTWVQTSPIPTPDPDPALFLHGQAKPGEPDVQVIFRNHLPADTQKWADWVACCPPSSSEALPVRISLFRRWLNGENMADDTADVEGGQLEPQELDDDTVSEQTALCWAGPDSDLTEMVNATQVLPNRTYVVSCTATNLAMLGDFPTLPPSDDSEQAFQVSRDRAILLFPNVKLRPDADDFELQIDELVASRNVDHSSDWLERAIDNLSDRRKRNVILIEKPDAQSEAKRDDQGIREVSLVIVGKKRLKQFDPTFSDEESTYVPSRYPVTLDQHTKDVVDHAVQFAKGCGLNSKLDAFIVAGRGHDVGKADPRFQAMLQNHSPRTIRFPLLAKSANGLVTPDDAKRLREIHRFPNGGRHEALSVSAMLKNGSDPLALMLTQSHHGHGRPVMRTMEDLGDELAPFKAIVLSEEYEVTPSDLAPHIANQSVIDRFWQHVREYGWYGLAYMEAIFRLADQAASLKEQESDISKVVIPDHVITSKITPSECVKLCPLPLTGLDGSNPLAYLAALGTLNVLQQRDPHVKLSWGWNSNQQTPVIHLAKEHSQNEILSILDELLIRTLEDHPVALTVELLEAKSFPPIQSVRQKLDKFSMDQRICLDWYVALLSELLPDVACQLQTVRKDYLIGNLRSVMKRTEIEHLQRTLFQTWDYADALSNQSLHWEPTEDRRHAYQWYMPSGDPTRNRMGGMLGANRLGIEAWPLFASFPTGDRLATRGFKGNRANNTFFTWPIWQQPLSPNGAITLLALPELQEEKLNSNKLEQYGVHTAFRLQKILVGKTPNFTTAIAVG